MSINDMKKEDLELLSYKDITNLLLEKNGAMNTKDLFQFITTKLELPKSTFENKIGDYYTTLTNDKRFLMLEDGCWDLRTRHTSDKVVVVSQDDDEEEELELKEDNDIEQEDDGYDIDSTASDEDEFDDSDDDLKDLVILDEDELELEQ